MPRIPDNVLHHHSYFNPESPVSIKEYPEEVFTRIFLQTYREKTPEGNYRLKERITAPNPVLAQVQRQTA